MARPATRIALTVLLLAAALAGAYQAWRTSGSSPPAAAQAGGERPPPRVDVEPAARRTVEETVLATGTLEAPERVRVTSETSGRVTEIAFREGTRVAAGDVLVRLERERASAGLAEARTRAREARRELERTETLHARDVVSDARLDEARTADARARAALRNAAEDLEDRRIEAPFAGVTGRREVSPGALVAPGDLVTTLSAVRALDLVFTVPGDLVGRARLGRPVRARTAAHPGRRFEGEVDFVGSEVDPATRSLLLQATLPNQEGLLKPGMFMEVELVLGEREAVTVPEAALLLRGPASYLFVVGGDDVARRVPVEPGLRREGWVEIVSGLDAGERVVVAGVQRVRDGEPVRTASAEASGERAP